MSSSSLNNLTINIPNNDIHSMDNNGSGAIQQHEKVKKKSALKKKKSASKKKKTSSSSLSVSTNTTSNHQGGNHEFLFKPCEVHFRPYSEQLQQQSTITTSDEKNNETISTTTTMTTMTSNDENGITPSETSAQQQLESIHKSNNNHHHHHHHHHSTIVSSLTLSLMKNTTTTTTSPHAEHSNNKKKNLVKSLTHDLVSQYKQCSSEFKYTSPKRILTQPSDPASNNGLDNVDGNLILAVDDVLGERYVVKDVLGMGTFGQVARCEDTQNIGSPHLAVKVIKNKRAYLKQAEVETQILRLLCQNYDPDNTHHIIRMDHYFFHQNHLCIVFEMLSINLFELIKQNRFRGLSTNVIRVFLSQMLDALCVLQKAKIIHCDLKPENILLTDLSSPKNLIKLIDFGSACFEKETVYSYIQSRFYRSPDVLFGVEYNCAIDMWSLGCICAELFLGLPLFPGASQYNQVARIVEMLGMPPAYLLDTGRTSRKYFKRKPYMMNPSDHPYEMKTEQEYCLENNDTPKEWKRYFNYTKLDDLIKYYSYKNIPQEEVKNEELNRVALIDLLHGLLHWDPNLRWTANQAKNHPFVTGEPFTGPFVPEIDAERTMIPIKTQHAVPYATAPPVATSWGNSYHNQPMPQQQQQQSLGKRVMSGGLSQQFVTPNSWGPQTGFLGSNVSLGNLGPSPNPMFGSYSQAQPVVQQQQQQQGAQQEKQGIPIGRGNQQQQQSWNQQSYGNNSYGYGSSPMYTSPMSSSGSYMGSSLNMPMVQGTPTNNYNNSYSSNSGGHWQGSLPNSFNGGNHMAFSPQQQPQQQQQQKWSQKKSSYRGTLSEQFNSMQLDNSPNVRQRSSSSATASSYNNSPRQQQQHQQQQQQQLQQYENHKGRARRESYAGQPRSHKSQKRRPSIQEQEPAMLSASLLNDPDYSSNAANEPSSPPFDSEMSSSSDNWNPFFPGEDLELDDAPPPPTSSSSTHHNNNNSSNNWSNSSYGNSQKNNNYNNNNNNNNNNTNNSYQSHQGRNRSSSFNNKKGQHNNEKAYRNNNGASGSSVGSFKQYHGNGSFVSSSSYDGNSYDPSMMYGSSPAMNMTGLGSSPSSYSNMNNPNNNNNSISGSGSYSHQAGGSWRNHNSNLNSFNNNNPPKKQQSQKR